MVRRVKQHTPLYLKALRHVSVRCVCSPSRPSPASWLPDEVLELVLGEVPAADLARSCRLVCRRWRRVLSGRGAWRRARLAVRVGAEEEACRALRRAPALAELALFPGERTPTRSAGLLLAAVRDAVCAGLELRALSLDWRHFDVDAESRACFDGILAALRPSLRRLDVGLYGVRPVQDGALPGSAQTAPVFAALAAMAGLESLRLRAFFDPCWYQDELAAPACKLRALRALDVAAVEPYLCRLLSDVVLGQARPGLTALRVSARGLAALAPSLAAREGPTPRTTLAAATAAAPALPGLQHLAVDLEQQDAPLPPAVLQALCSLEALDSLTLERANRRLPSPGHDLPSETVRSLSLLCRTAGGAETPKASPRCALVLDDCLVSPADVAALIALSFERLVFHGGCFLDSASSLALLEASASAGRTRLFCRGLRLCPRDSANGLYPLALET